MYDFSYGHDVTHGPYITSSLSDDTHMKKCDPNDIPSGWAPNEEEDEEEEEEEEYESQTSDDETYSS